MTSLRWIQRLLILVMLCIALWLRVHQLEQFPAGLHFDEAANAILSREIAFDHYRPIFISSYTGKETLFFYAAGGVMNRLGASIFTLRLTAAFFGLLTIAATYRLGIAIFRDRRIALIAAIFLTVNFAHLLFSRLGFRAISQPLTQALTVLFLIEGLRRLYDHRPAKIMFAVAGLFLGLTAHTYLAARLFPVALAIPLLLFAVFLYAMRPKTNVLTQTLFNFGLTGLVASIVLAPLLYWFYLNPDAFWVRIGQVSASDEMSIPEGLRRTILMLFWDGDPYIRFNLPHRPLFFPMMLVPSAVGIWQLISQKGKSVDGALFGRMMILIAPFIMLLPTALATSEILPSNLRAIGIFPFIVFWPAVGLVWLMDRLLRWVTGSTNLEYAFIPLYIVLLGLSASNVTRDYFTVWGTRPDSFYETEGDIREVATYLNQLDSERPLLVSTRFVPHPALAFLTQDYDQLRLIPESRALVYPAGEPPVYVFPASSPENDWIASMMGDRERFSTGSAVPTFTTLRLGQPFPKGQTAVFGNFGYAVTLVGFDLEPGQVGESLTLRTYYDVMENPGFNMIPFVHLEDHLGNRWSQIEQPGYSPDNWQAGDQFAQEFELPIPAGLPPTSGYTLRIGWFDQATGQEVTRFDPDGRFVGSAFLIQGVAVLSNNQAKPSAEASQPLNKSVADGLNLRGLDFGRRQYSQGDELNFALWWQADKQLPDIKLMTQITQGENTIQLESVDPAGDSYPFFAWQPGSFVIDQHQMQLPADLPPGEWQLQTFARFVGQAEPAQALFSPILITVDSLELVLEPPVFEQQIDQTFENQLKLSGYTFDATGGALEIIWQTVGKPAGDYVAFVQLLNADQTCCIWQADRPLISSNNRPTTRWLVGEYVVDRYQVENHQTGGGLIVGVYRPENGIRLVTAQQADFVELR